MMRLTAITTTYEGKLERTEVTAREFLPDNGRENQLFMIFPEVTYQSFEGFGGAVTESAGTVYRMMNREQKDRLIYEYFSEEEMNYQHVRIPIDSCDFSLGHYEAMSDLQDTMMESFDLKRMEKSILSVLDDMEHYVSKKIPIMLSPWSPPSFMKTNGKRNGGGKLKKEYYKNWAEYICRYVSELQTRGYLVERLSIQNEPKASQAWDSCVYSAEEEKEFLRDYLHPALCRNGLEGLELFVWDHNKERLYERACSLIDENTDFMIAGLAFHWYSGDHFEQISMVHERFPDKKLILSEACIEFTKFDEDHFLDNARKYAHDMIGNLNHGMTGFYDWNMLLNEEGGPNHVKNYCDAPFRYDAGKKELIKGTIAVYLKHFCHYIHPGAVRIGCSGYERNAEMTAWKNVDGSIVIILLNQTEEIIEGYVRIGEQCAECDLKGESITTIVIQ